MPLARDFLDRFRPVAAPGAAGRAGVPADRAGDLAAELLPVLASLEGVNAECGEITSRAREEARQVIQDSQADVAQITADARRRAEAVRDEAAQQVLAGARADAERLAASGRAEAQRVRAVAADRIPVLAAQATATVAALASGAPGNQPAGPPP